MSALSHILAPEDPEPLPVTTLAEDTGKSPDHLPTETTSAPIMPAKRSPPKGDDRMDDPADMSTVKSKTGKEQDDQDAAQRSTSAKQNVSANGSGTHQGSRMAHLKKPDGEPLWRKDIQYDFLCGIFHDKTRCFTRFSDRSQNHTFAEVYADAVARSSKSSRRIRERLLQQQEGAVPMAMVCLLVNMGRMDTTLNFFPEMRSHMRTYNPIPALQVHEAPNSFRLWHDAPRLKSYLRGAAEDEPQPNDLGILQETPWPRTNPVNLVYVLSQNAKEVGDLHLWSRQPLSDEEHDESCMEFSDLIMQHNLNSADRANAFLWLMWHYMECDFTHAHTQPNPFGPGQHDSGATEADPIKVPVMERLSDDGIGKENVDTPEEIKYAAVKKEERAAVLTKEPYLTTAAHKRSRKEPASAVERTTRGTRSDDEASEGDLPALNTSVAGRSSAAHDFGSEDTRSPSPRGMAGSHAYSANPDMRINSLLNMDEAMLEASSPQAATAPTGGLNVKKGPGRGNWRRNRTKQDTASAKTDDRALLPNTGQLSFINEGPYHLRPPSPGGHRKSLVRTSSQNQAQKRNRGVTQHQSAVINYRKQRIDYALAKKMRQVHGEMRERREREDPFMRAWKRICTLPPDYDSEEEMASRKMKDHAENNDGKPKEKENCDSMEDSEGLHQPRLSMGGLAGPQESATLDYGEDARSMAKTFSRCLRRLDRWEKDTQPGRLILKRRELQAQRLIRASRQSSSPEAEAGTAQASRGSAPSKSTVRRRARKPAAELALDNSKAGERMDVDQQDGEVDEDGELDDAQRGFLDEADPQDTDEASATDDDVDVQMIDGFDRAKSAGKRKSRLSGGA